MNTEGSEEGLVYSQEKEELLNHLNYFSELIEQNQHSTYEWKSMIFTQDETQMVIHEILTVWDQDVVKTSVYNQKSPIIRNIYTGGVSMN